MVCPEHSEFLCTLSLVTESRNVLSQEHPRPQPWLPLSAHTALTPLLCSSRSELTWPTFCQQNPLLSWRYLWPCQHGIYIWILIMGDFSQLSALDLWTDIFSCTKCTLFVNVIFRSVISFNNFCLLHFPLLLLLLLPFSFLPSLFLNLLIYQPIFNLFCWVHFCCFFSSYEHKIYTN